VGQGLLRGDHTGRPGRRQVRLGPAVPPRVFLAAWVAHALVQAIHLWAKAANRWLATVVRIRKERGQKVCADGPYRFTRHPGYAGGLLFMLATPLLLRSWLALIRSRPHWRCSCSGRTRKTARCAWSCPAMLSSRSRYATACSRRGDRRRSSSHLSLRHRPLSAILAARATDSPPIHCPPTHKGVFIWGAHGRPLFFFSSCRSHSDWPPASGSRFRPGLGRGRCIEGGIHWNNEPAGIRDF